MQEYDYNTYGSTNGCPFYHLLNLLASTLPSYTEQRGLFECADLAKDPTVTQAKVWEWFTNHKERYQSELTKQAEQ